MKTQRFEIRIESIDGFIDISQEIANHLENWLQSNSPHDKIKAYGDFIGEEN